jgi:hypothetical protein
MPINDNLRKAGIELPPNGVYSSSHDLPEGLTGEKYYDLLEDRFSTEDTGENDALGRSLYTIKVDGEESSVGVGNGQCGSCSGESAGTIESSLDKELGRSDTEIYYIKKKGSEALREAGKSRPGMDAGFFKEILDFSDAKRAIVPWERSLNNLVRRSIGRMRAGFSDFSIKRPSRRTYTSGILRPGMVCYDPDIAVIEDVSGSMGAEQLVTGRTEIISAATKLGINNFWYLQADSRVAMAPTRIRAKELRTLPAMGRGGTSFRESIEAVCRLRPRPHLTIYVTDGDAYDLPEHAPKNMHFIWLIVPSSWSKKPCDWGTHILMSNLAEEREGFYR